MNKDKQRLLQKLYDVMHMCIEQGLEYEWTLLSRIAGGIENEFTSPEINKYGDDNWATPNTEE